MKTISTPVDQSVLPAIVGKSWINLVRQGVPSWKSLVLLCYMVSAVKADQFGDFTYTENSNSITIDDYPDDAVGAVVIPASINDKPVTRIGTAAFFACHDITTVIIPDSVTSIGDEAFSGCHGLTSVTIPHSVISIGDRAFGFCDSLMSIDVNGGNQVYGSWLGILYKIIPITHHYTLIQCPGGLTTVSGFLGPIDDIEEFAFAGGKLTYIDIPNGVTTIRYGAFSYCHSLERVFIPPTVYSIELRAFFRCRSLQRFEVSGNNGYTSIGGALYYKPQYTNPWLKYLIQCPGGLGSLDIVFGTIAIEQEAFSGCDHLTSVTIPNSVTYIGNRAFQDCTGLTRVIIPAEVGSIHFSAFSGCSGLMSVTFRGDNPLVLGPEDAFDGTQASFRAYFDPFKYGFSQPEWDKYRDNYPTPAPPSSEISVQQPAGFNLVGWKDKQNFAAPNTSKILTIKNNGNANLTNLGVIKDGANPDDFTVTAMGVSTLPPGASTTVTVTFNPTAPGERSAEIQITSNDADEDLYSIEFTGSGTGSFPLIDFTYTDDGTSITIIGYPTTTVGAVVIPATVIGKPVTRIGDSAFVGCLGLTSVTIPASVTSIGNSVFYGCSSFASIVVDANNPVYSSSSGVLFNKLKTTLIQYPYGGSGSYMIPPSVTSIGFYAFYDCAGLTGVTIPASVTTVAEGAFFDCDGLTSVTIPASVTDIGVNCLFRCRNLISIEVDGNNPNYSSSAGVLFNKLKTTLIQYPGGASGSYEIPSTVTSIFADSFTFCPDLTSVTIPSSVTSIGNFGFLFCDSLTSATFMGDAPSLMGVGVFDWAADGFTIYYSASATDFPSPDWLGYPTALIPVQSWQIDNFGSHSALEAALDNDADKDGLSNLLEYAFNLEPQVPDTSVLETLIGESGLPSITPTGSGASQRLRLEYVRKKASSNPGITYLPQFTSTLQGSGTGGWAAATGTEAVEFIDNEWERVVVEDMAGTGGSQRFGRVKVTNP